MSDAYRKHPDGDALGEPERENAAISVFGKWRDRIRMRVVLVFALIGLVPAALTYYLVQDYQFAHNLGRALILVNVASSAIVWMSTFGLGAFIGRRVVRARSREKLEWLAKQYDVPLGKLEETATMVDKL